MTDTPRARDLLARADSARHRADRARHLAALIEGESAVTFKVGLLQIERSTISTQNEPELMGVLRAALAKEAQEQDRLAEQFEGRVVVR